MGGGGTGRRACGRAGGRVDRKILTTGGGSGVRQSASRRSTIESHRRTTRPAPRYSRRPPVPAHSPPRPSVPFTLPRSLPPPTLVGRAATDVSLFDPPASAASARVWSVAAACLPPVPPRLSPTTPPRAAATHGGLSGAGTRTVGRTGGRAEVGGRPGTRRRSPVAGVRLHTTKKGDAHEAEAVRRSVPRNSCLGNHRRRRTTVNGRHLLLLGRLHRERRGQPPSVALPHRSARDHSKLFVGRN